MAESEAIPVGIILSDHVIREQGSNKLTLIGCFTRYNLPRFPIQVPPFWITLLLTNFAGPGKYSIGARIEIPQKSIIVVNASGSIEFSDLQWQSGGGRDNVFELPIRVPQTQFSFPGTYQVTVLFEGDEIGRRPLIVNPLNTSATPS